SSPAKRSKPGLVTKRRKPTNSLRSVDESIDKGIPKKEPRFDDEDVDIQRAVEESLKSVHDASRAPRSSKTVASAEYTAWTPTDTRLMPFVSSIPEDLHMDADMALDAQAHSSDDEDIRNAHIPKYQIEEFHKLLTDSVDESIIRHNVSKPLPLGGPPGQVTIQSEFFFNKDLEYLRYSSKSGRHALSISKMKAVYYLDVGLEQMVPD
nr:hypothetical protein [Tanacetum cinerariifolium]